MYDHFDNAKWLFSLGGVDHNAYNNNDPFEWSCYNDNLEMAKWLFSLGGNRSSLRR